MKYPNPKIRNCNGCGAAPGTRHEKGCDIARCQHTGYQEISCEVNSALNDWDHDHMCVPDMWSGRWPGDAECEEYGLWCYFVPNGNPCWVPCAQDHPEGVHDLNRLMLEYAWDRDRQKWVPPSRRERVATC